VGVLRKNILANYVGQGAAAVIGFVVVPLYLKYLGPQGYGLVAFFMSLQTVMMLFDMGMSTSASREIARALELTHDPNARRHMLRTLEVFYYALAAVMFGLAAVSARWLAHNWVKSDSLDVATILKCVYMASACIAFRFPVSLYQGFFRGIEKQVDLNVIFTNLVVIKGVGGVLTLAFISPTVIAFYWWQLIFGAGEVLAMAWYSWRNVGGVFKSPAYFRWNLLKDVWRFAIKMGGISIFAVIMKQLDKLAVSRMLPIQFVGYYSTASMAANALIKVYAPVQSAVFPRFTRMISRGEDIASLFHANCQFIAFVAAPLSAALIVLPVEILRLWTGSPALAQAAGTALALQAIWTLAAALQSIPNMVQLAQGMTWLPLRVNVITTVLLIPALIFAIAKFGIVGAAACWCVQGVLTFLIVPNIMFRHALKAERARYYFNDTLPFVAAAIGCFVAMRLLLPTQTVLQVIAVGASATWCYAILCWACSRTLRARLESIPVGGKAFLWARRTVENVVGRMRMRMV
jgi:O-antigen/teichoic acid export membrane protein